MKSKNDIDMTNGSLLPKMLLFALPLMASSLLQLLFNLADVAVIGKFASEHSLAAVTSTGSLINLLTNLFLGLSIGANVLSAKYIGAKDYSRNSLVVHTSVVISLIFGVFLSVVGVIFAPVFLRMMSQPESVIQLASLYLRIYFLGMPAMMLYNFASSLLRSKGDTKRPLFFLTAAGVLNVGLNLIFVIVFRMDVAGVALATIISQYFSAFLIFRCLMHEDDSFRLTLSALKIDTGSLKLMLRIGVPAGLQGVVFSLSNVVIQSSVNQFGEIVIAGNGIGAQVEGFVWVSMNCFHQTALAFTSQNIGAGKYSRINKILVRALLCAFTTGVIFGNLSSLCSGSLLSLLSKSPDAIAYGARRLRIIGTTYFTCGIMDAICGSIRGMGYSVVPTIVSMIGACGLRLLWIFTVFQIPQYHELEILYISYPISWVITFLAHLTCFIVFRRKFPKDDVVALKQA